MQEDFDVLQDELGRNYIVLDAFSMEGHTYVVLKPEKDEQTDEKLWHVHIYRMEEGEESNEFLSVEDETTLDRVFRLFQKRNAQRFDFEQDKTESDHE